MARMPRIVDRRLIKIIFISVAAMLFRVPMTVAADCPPDWWIQLQTDIDWVISKDRDAYGCALQEVQHEGVKALQAMQDCNEHGQFRGLNLDACVHKACDYLTSKRWTPAC
jgi:hypothetical protein